MMRICENVKLKSIRRNCVIGGLTLDNTVFHEATLLLQGLQSEAIHFNLFMLLERINKDVYGMR